MRNLIEWGCAKDGKFDMIKYASIYCKADVEVLKKGWIVFRDSLLSEYDIDVFSYPTMASLADAYFIEQGCFEGVHKMAGVPRAFIANASVGGRVMCADNQPVRTNEKLADFDGVGCIQAAWHESRGIFWGRQRCGTREWMCEKSMVTSLRSKCTRWGVNSGSRWYD